jgi:predicted nucleic acid-binding protein
VKRVFVDANVFLRFFTEDDDGQHERAERLFRAGAEGKVVLISGPPVLFEVAWTLRAAYRRSAGDVLDAIESILALPGLSLTDDAIASEALRLARAGGVEFPDAYIAALARACGAEAIATFNVGDFRRLGARCHAW